jgi:hypothetical protein
MGFGFQQREPPEQPARFAVDRLGGQGGQLVPQVRLDEGAEADSLTLETVKGLAQRVFAGDSADNEVRMFLLGRKEMTGRFGHGMAGLDKPLGRREVLADQNVHVTDLCHRTNSSKESSQCSRRESNPDGGF